MKLKSILSGSLKSFIIITFILIEVAGAAYGLIRYSSEVNRIKAHHKKHNISNESLQIRLKQNKNDTIFQFIVYSIALGIAGGFSVVIYQKQARNIKSSIDEFSELLTEAVKQREKLILSEHLNYQEFDKITNSLNEVLEDIHHKENYNSLTNLPKKHKFIKDSLEVFKVKKSPMIVVYIHLKDYNNLLKSRSFEVVDKVVLELANRLVTFSKNIEDSIVAKISGNGDFLLSFPCPKYPEACYNLVSNRLHADFGEKIDLQEDGSYEQGIGIGFGILNDENQNNILDGIYKAAILSTLQEGKLFCNYSDELKLQIDIEARLENDLKIAVDGKFLEVFYQAKVGADDGKVKGAEALVRWFRYSRFENTEKFIKIAEQTDLIIKLERLVISKVFAEQRKLQDSGIFLPISINISAKHFSSGSLIATLEENSKTFNIEPKYIEIEVVEREKLNINNSLDILNRLKELGYLISLDDFGKDYSSLSYISNIPIDSIKIDKSFIDGLASSDKTAIDNSKAIVSGIIKIAKSINKRTIAEGVETLEQVNLLKELGCDELQGFYYHQGATPMDEFLKIYENRL